MLRINSEKFNGENIRGALDGQKMSGRAINGEMRAAERLSARELSTLLNELLEEAPRLERLKNYYRGKNDILYRRKEGSNIRLNHGFARLISQMLSSFCYGKGLEFSGFEGLNIEKLCPRAVEMRLLVDQSVYGRSVSLFYEDEEGLKLCALEPKQAHVVYTRHAKPRPLFGLLDTGKSLIVYDENSISEYTRDDKKRLISRRRHSLKALPMIEYFNNSDMQGDFEHALELIDAYDLLASDRMNDRVQFADAMLVLTGVMGICEDENEGQRLLRAKRTLALPDSDAKAEWLVKNPTEKDIEVLRQSLADDIHKFCCVPDFQSPFSLRQASSQIKFQLLSLKAQIRQKQAFFMEGLNQRLRAIEKYHSLENGRLGAKFLEADELIIDDK